jgi:hypothetical protein
MKPFRTLRAAIAGAFFGFRAAFGSFSEATQATTDRSSNFVVLLDADTRQYLDPWTRAVILRKVEWLFQNFGVVKEAVRGIARLTVGKGISLTLNTDDEEWNALAEAAFESWAMSPNRCDLAGRRNFYEIQAHAVSQRIKSGEFFAAFARNPRWQDEPCLQLFDVLEIENPSDALPNGNIVDGVKLDANHCPVAYYVRGLDGKHTPIPASEMVHWYHADGTNQVRGVSDFAQAVAPLADAKELAKIVTKTAKQNSAIGLHVKKLVKKGGQGALDTIRTLSQRANAASGAAPGSDKTAPSTDPDPAHERLVGGGAIIYTDENGDAKFLTPNSPSPLVEPFITKVLMRDGLASTGMRAEIFWDCSQLNSANQRAIFALAENTTTTLGDGAIGRLCNPAAVRFLIHRMDTGKLRRPRIRILTLPEPAQSAMPVETWREDTDGAWMNCLAWQLPARLSIDNGRDAAAEISQLDNNIETLATLHDRRGRGWRSMVDQWFRECAYAARAAEKHGAKWALTLWRRGMPGASSAQQPEADQEEKPDTPAQEQS